jgi:hypothetical protein
MTITPFSDVTVATTPKTGDQASQRGNYFGSILLEAVLKFLSWHDTVL